MKFNMTALALVLIGALTANAANLRSNSSGHFPACPQGGWTYNAVNSHCYKAFPKESFPAEVEPPYYKALQWDHAKKRCAKYDAYIAVPNDAAENKFLRGMIPNNDYFFLGYDQADLTQSMWMDGTPQNKSFSVYHAQAGTVDTAFEHSNPDYPTRLPKGAKLAARTNQNWWRPVGATAIKPVLVMQGAPSANSQGGSWRFDFKYQDYPFVCELVWCGNGCNTQEKSPGTKDSANTIVADADNVDHEAGFMSR